MGMQLYYYYHFFGSRGSLWYRDFVPLYWPPSMILCSRLVNRISIRIIFTFLFKNRDLLVYVVEKIHSWLESQTKKNNSGRRRRSESIPCIFIRKTEIGTRYVQFGIHVSQNCFEVLIYLTHLFRHGF